MIAALLTFALGISPELYAAILAALAGIASGFIISRTLKQISTAWQMINAWLAAPEKQLIAEITKEQAFAKAAEATEKAHAAALEQIRTYCQTTFTSKEEIMAGYDEFLALERQGVISEDEFVVAAKWSLSESDRLAALPVTPVVPVPSPEETAADELARATYAVRDSVKEGTGAIGQELGKTSSGIDNLSKLLPLGMSVAMTGAITALLAGVKNWGHDTAKSTQTCWAGTAANILSTLVTPVLTLGELALPEKWSPLKIAMDAVVDDTFRDIFNAPELQGEITPEAAEGVARMLFKKATQLGVEAQFISATVEAFQPLKSIGFGYLAAFLGDMAGFAKIGGAMMGTIETQALARPFGYFSNNKTRTLLPTIREAMSLYGDRKLERPDFDQLLAYNGLARGYEDSYADMSYRPVSYFMLRALADSGDYDEEYVHEALEHATYNNKTIGKMKDMLKSMSQGEFKTLFTGYAMTRFRDGQDNETQLSTNLVLSGVRDFLIQRYIDAAKLQKDHDAWLETQKAAQEKPKELVPVMLSTAISRYKEGWDNESKFTYNLTFLGVDPRLLDRYVYAADLEADYDDKLDYLAVLKDAVAKGAIEPPAMQQLLVEKGMREAKAELYAERAALGLLKAPAKT